MVQSNTLKCFPIVPYQRGSVLSKKKTEFLSHSGHKTAAILGGADFVAEEGMVLMVEVVGVGRGGRVEGLGGGGKCERKRRQRYDHQ